MIASSGTATLSGTLLEDGIKPIAGRTVHFTLGLGRNRANLQWRDEPERPRELCDQPGGAASRTSVVADAFAGEHLLQTLVCRRDDDHVPRS